MNIQDDRSSKNTMVEIKPEKVGNFIRRTMDEIQASKKNPQFDWSETQNFKNKMKNINNEWHVESLQCMH